MMRVAGMRVDATSYPQATEKILAWAAAGQSRYVCVANVHMVMEAHDAADVRQIVQDADLVTPDGMPLVWMMRHKGLGAQERVYGPSLMLRVLAAAAGAGLPVGVYGGEPRVLERLVARLRESEPQLRLAYSCSPPFRELSAEERAAIALDIRRSGARILFVGLGCPKQERWMAAERGRTAAVMLGVGAAFEFLSGSRPQAPAWMMAAGLEWFFRLVHEPRRLWRRYLFHNPRFALLAAGDLLRPGST